MNGEWKLIFTMPLNDSSNLVHRSSSEERPTITRKKERIVDVLNLIDDGMTWCIVEEPFRPVEVSSSEATRHIDFTEVPCP